MLKMGEDSNPLLEAHFSTGNCECSSVDMLLPAFFQGNTQFPERVYSSLLKHHSLPYSLTNLAEGYSSCVEPGNFCYSRTPTSAHSCKGCSFWTLGQILSFLALLRLGWLQPWGTKYVPKEPEPKSKAPAGSQRLDRGILDQT